MDSPFAYNRFVVENDFLSRKKELNNLTNLLREKKHAVIYEPQKTGKRSLIQQTLLNLQKLSYNFNICEINLLNIRSSDIFFRTLAAQIAACVSNTLTDWNTFSNKYIQYLQYDNSTPLTDSQIDSIIDLPEKICVDFDTNIIIYIEEFQNILLFDDGEDLLKLLEKKWASHKETTYLISGSRLNAMKLIFEEEKYFFNFAEHIKLYPIEEKAIIDHIVRVFLKVGRVVDQSQALQIYQSVQGHPWYIWHISNMCYNLTKGYLNDKLIQEATNSLLQIHEIRFKDIMSNLSNYQINLLKAIFCGETRFSSSEIIDQYKLNSSANVFRIKEALKKKEVITFDENDIPSIIDPLFTMWLKKYYFINE